MLSEFELIRRYFTHRARGAVLGVGDDAALLRVRRGMQLAVSADMLVAGRHFDPAADPRRLGHKALAVNLSDMAAMGATPRWVTLALALPVADARWLAAFARGFMDLARRHQVDLVGGDTTQGPLNICVQVMGEVPAGMALRRDGARIGDDVWISGTPGDAALALAIDCGECRALPPRDRSYVRARLDAPTPRLSLGVALRGVARSAIDVSDGLVADLGHICEQSGVAARVELARLPRSPAMQRFRPHGVADQAALTGGDDYELCFTAGAGRRAALAALSQRLKLPLTRIGQVVRSVRRRPRVEVVDVDGRAIVLKHAGFEHFQQGA